MGVHGHAGECFSKDKSRHMCVDQHGGCRCLGLCCTEGIERWRRSTGSGKGSKTKPKVLSRRRSQGQSDARTDLGRGVLDRLFQGRSARQGTDARGARVSGGRTESNPEGVARAIWQRLGSGDDSHQLLRWRDLRWGLLEHESVCQERRRVAVQGVAGCTDLTMRLGECASKPPNLAAFAVNVAA